MKVYLPEGNTVENLKKEVLQITRLNHVSCSIINEIICSGIIVQLVLTLKTQTKLTILIKGSR